MNETLSAEYIDPRTEPDRHGLAQGFVAGLAQPNSMYAPDRVDDYLGLRAQAASKAWEESRVGNLVIDSRFGFVALEAVRNSWGVTQMRQEFKNGASPVMEEDAQRLANLGQTALRLSDSLGIMADTTEQVRKNKYATGLKITGTALMSLSALAITTVALPAFAPIAAVAGIAGVVGLAMGAIESLVYRPTTDDKLLVSELRTTQVDLATISDGLLDRLKERRMDKENPSTALDSKPVLPTLKPMP
jgi:hypothetical protein